jgi:predicted Zn finger-like uncharacterized protein
MYTQCPECHTAFRVTARVLQQAGGRVRCGGCSSAFNALEYLSEELPAADPDPDTDSQNKKLLDTLNQLAGPENVIIEDTGVEWQVLEEPTSEETTGEGDAANGTMRWTLADEAEAVPEILDVVPLADPADEEAMRFDDNTPLPDDFDSAAPAPPAPPQRRTEDRIEHESKYFDELQIDLALGDRDEWIGLLDEVHDDPASVEPGVPSEVENEAAAKVDARTSRSSDHRGGALPTGETGPPADVESQFDSQAEALGLDVTGSHKIELAAQDEEEAAADAIAAGEDDEEALAPGGAPGHESTGALEEQAEADRLELAAQDPDATALDDEQAGTPPSSPDRSDPDVEFVRTMADEDDIAEQILRGEIEAAELVDTETDADVPAAMTAESDASESPKGLQPAKKLAYPQHIFDENANNVETIIMEGDLVHASLADELEVTRNQAANLEGGASFADTYSTNRETLRGGRRKSDPAGFGKIAAVICLALLLAGQIVHSSRQTLATFGLFNQTIAPIYRMAGKPVIPAWNISGWQFQTTSGATDENGARLTIYSTVANRSSKPLPYPLVHVSLTDRWEEIIGSRVLEPNEYLAGDVDPGKPVAPGDKFTAVISVDSPSPEATGFKLNVCYRVGPGQVRCANQDFKD